MDNKSIVGRQAELDGIRNGLSSNGSAKGFIFIGEAGIGKTTMLEESWRTLSCSPTPIIWIAPNFSTAKDEFGAASSLARGIDTSSADLRAGLSAFARAFGQKVFEIQRESTKTDLSGDPAVGAQLAEQWFVHLFEALPELKASGGGSPLVVVAVDDVSKLSAKVADWLIGEFLPKWKEAGIAERTRYIFAAETKPDGQNLELIKSACDGRVIEMKLRGLRSAECSELARFIGHSSPDGENLRTLSGGNPGRLLQILGNAKNQILHTEIPMNQNEEQTASTRMIEGFSSEETEHLFRVAYLPQTTKDSLALFCNPREASLSFNWVKNTGGLAESLPGNAISLYDDIRAQAISLHAEVRPEEAAEWEIRAECHVAFEKTFPSPRSRWIPLRLAHFQCFDEDVLHKLFGEDASGSMMGFINEYPELFEEVSGLYKLRHEVMESLNRYKSVMNNLSDDEDDLSAKITEAWTERKSDGESKRNHLESERDNLHQELSVIDKQMDGLKGLKDNLLQSFLDPESRKPKRELSFTIAKVLLVLGLVTIAASLAFRDLLGAYHAAAGIFLTLFGFFWPSIKWQTQQQIAESGGMDRFAIETQQRMLGHRVTGLNTRKVRLSNSINEIDEDIEKLDVILQQPYVSNG
jgi:hypothetical protein